MNGKSAKDIEIHNHNKIYDGLTGLLEPDIFFDRVAEIVRDNPAGKYVMSAIDIDQFKLINDNYGMETGDRVLVMMSKALQQRVKNGLVCRVSSDCFATLTKVEDTNMGVPEKYNWNRINLETGFPSISVSVGLYVVSDLELLPTAMYDRAVIAKKTIKGSYKSTAAIYDESMRLKILEEREIVKESVGALRDKQFEIWLQPQYTFSPEQVVSAEALVRWRHPVKGIIPPNSFIPIFESNGFIYELDKFVFEEAVRTIRKWIDEGHKPLPISVNFSRVDILQEDFIERITEIIEKYQVPVNLVHIEITESAFTTRFEAVLKVIERLHKYGFVIEIDDFGSGYSSLNILKDVEADSLKMDMRFLVSDKIGKRSGIILESCIRMASWLGMHIIAEGVETKQQAEFLNSINCDKIQGFYYARPMPVPEYENILRSEKRTKEIINDKSEDVAIMDLENLWNPSSDSVIMFSKYVGAAGLFEWNNESLGIVRGNNEFLNMIGTDMEFSELTRMNILDNADENTRQYIIDVLNRVNFGDSEEGIVDMKVYKDNTVVIKSFKFNAHCLAYGKGRKEFYIMFNDVTEREAARKNERQLIESLQQSQDFLAQMVNEMFGNYHRVRCNPDKTFTVVIASDGFCYFMNQKREKILQNYKNFQITELIHPDDISDMTKCTDGVIAKPGIQGGIRVRYKRDDGQYVYMFAFYRGITDAEGQKYIDIYLADDDKKLADNKEMNSGTIIMEIIKRNMKETDLVVRNIPAAVGVFEYYDNIVYPLYISDKALEILHYTREEYNELRDTDDTVLSLDLVNEKIKGKDSIKEGTYVIEMPIRKSDRTMFDARLTMNTIREGTRYKVFVYMEELSAQG